MNDGSSFLVILEYFVRSMAVSAEHPRNVRTVHVYGVITSKEASVAPSAKIVGC